MSHIREFVRKYIAYGKIILIVAPITGFALYKSWGIEPKGTPLLNGAPEFIILSLITALTLYLREVNLNTQELRYKIYHGELWNVLPESAHRPEKLKRLQETSGAIMVASPFMFVLILATSARIIWDSYLRLASPIKRAPACLYRCDIVITVWLFLALFGLTVTHFVVRRRDGKLEDKIRKDVDQGHGALSSM